MSIVNLTLFTDPAGDSVFDVPIPPTTAGNTLVVGLLQESPAGSMAITGAAFIEAPNAYVNVNHGTIDIFYATNVAAGISTLHVDGSGNATLVIVYEITPANFIMADATRQDNGSAATVGPLLTDSQSDFYVNFAIKKSIHSDGQDDISSVSASWMLDAAYGAGAVLWFSGGESMASASLIATGTQQVTFSPSSDVPYNFVVSGAVFRATTSPPPPPPPPPSPPPCAPVDSHNMLTSGVLIDDLSLFIGPATALYKTPVLPNVINSYETTSEGRHEIVLDFNAGDGLYARDLGTVFSWPLNVVGKAKTVLYTWQPAIIAMPEGSYGRATDWMDGGTNGAKFIQGVMIEADSFNNAKTFFLQDSDTLAMHPLNETPATFNKQSEKAFSCTPFVAHSARIISTDGVEWRVWSSKLVFQPWPEMALNWQTEMTSLGLTGWGHVREMNLPYVATAPVTLVLTFDAWPTITLILPNTGGVQNKTKLTLPPNKFKLMGLRAFSSQGFRLFEKDLELKIKAWGTTEAYTIVRPFGGPSRAGAVV